MQRVDELYSEYKYLHHNNYILSEQLKEAHVHQGFIQNLEKEQQRLRCLRDLYNGLYMARDSDR